MMKSWILLLFIGIAQTTFAQVDVNSDFCIVGKWKGNDGSNDGAFIFDTKGNAIIQTKEVTLGGENFSRGDKIFRLTYKINLQEEPYQLDFTFTELKSQRTMVWPCIFKVITNDQILLSRGTNGTRPLSFMDFESITLKRIQ